MRYTGAEAKHAVREAPTGRTMNVAAYDLSDGSTLSLSVSTMTEIGTTGFYRWPLSNITNLGAGFREVLVVMTDATSGVRDKQKFVVRGYVENVDVATSSRSQPGDAMDLVVDAVDAAALAADALAEIADAVLTESVADHQAAADSLARGVSFLLDVAFGDTRIDRTNPSQWVEQHLDRATGLTVVAEYDLQGLDGTPISDSNNPFANPTSQNAAFMRRVRTVGTP